MKIKDGEVSIKGYLIGFTRVMLMILLGIGSFFFKEGYNAIKGLTTGVTELNVSVKNLINVTDKITTRIDNNTNNINKLNVRVSVLETKVK